VVERMPRRVRQTMVRRSLLVMAALLVVVAGTGVAVLWTKANDVRHRDTVTSSRPVQLSTVAAGSDGNLTVLVVNVVDRDDRIRVDLGGRSAVDAVFPSAGRRAHPPVFRYDFDVPVGPTELRVRTPGETGNLRFTATAERRWVVVQNQTGVPLVPELYDERPVFG
jgi:hypothetical protein